MAMNEARTIPLRNLKLIRGQNLYEGKYALLVMSNYKRNNSSAVNYTGALAQLQLSNLTGEALVLNGSGIPVGSW